MGIYYDDEKIYGIMWNICDEYNNVISTFEKKYDKIMTKENIQEIKREYHLLTEEQKKYISIHFFTMCTSTYEINQNQPFLYRCPANKQKLENLFNSFGE